MTLDDVWVVLHWTGYEDCHVDSVWYNSEEATAREEAIYQEFKSRTTNVYQLTVGVPVDDGDVK
jgi:hypothetical protein